MKKNFVGLIFLLLIIVTSCQVKKPTNEELFNELQKTINEIDNYMCKAEITIIGNKSPAEYSATHLFSKPNKYRIEYDDGKQIITYDGNKTYLIYPDIDKSSVIRNNKKTEEDKSFFIGYFIQLILTNEEMQLENEKQKGKDYFVISLEMPGNNIYRAKQRLWIDKKNFKPYKMVILDKDEKERVIVYYKEFKYNVNVSEQKLFNQ
ncbi:outer membrane lipoprotein carrier protein LolA [Clostridium sp. D2Q-14]|uniref:outer membrane lipoprotein carrier protein LolA n=1 Tax=Anaeromonas gelatinilytica TaxID=2683194 RepID=UPI00193B09F9|nr:outer membrane lipoprotein carrier protein LolA [Anaeromonas gelatinilytica]MBS4534817.1 outer membrane lipoprotein carrier protein LolA [Anaeromonas gelatinilytica]